MKRAASRSRGVPRLRWAARLLLAPASMLALAACNEPPSYRARWRVEPRELGGPSPTSARMCSEAGIALVRIIARDATGEVADISEFPCFPRGFTDANAAVAGPSLSGVYDLVAQGVRGTAPRLGWPLDPDVDPALLPRCASDRCEPEFSACDCLSEVALDPENGQRLDGFVLSPPPPCRDTVDNDRDGLVDENDPGCVVSDLESTPAPPPMAPLLVELALLGVPAAAPAAATCSTLGIATFAFELTGAEEPVELEVPCEEARIGVVLGDFSAGQYTLTAWARGPEGEDVVQPETRTLALEAGVATAVALDFGPEDFLDPLELPASFVIPCRGFDSPLTAALALLDARGRLVDGPFDGQPAEVPCDTPLTTDPLPWGAYLLRAELFGEDGEVCWTNAADPALLRPVDPLTIGGFEAGPSERCPPLDPGLDG